MANEKATLAELATALKEGEARYKVFKDGSALAQAVIALSQEEKILTKRIDALASETHAAQLIVDGYGKEIDELKAEMKKLAADARANIAAKLKKADQEAAQTLSDASEELVHTQEAIDDEQDALADAVAATAKAQAELVQVEADIEAIREQARNI